MRHLWLLSTPLLVWGRTPNHICASTVGMIHAFVFDVQYETRLILYEYSPRVGASFCISRLVFCPPPIFSPPPFLTWELPLIFFFSSLFLDSPFVCPFFSFVTLSYSHDAVAQYGCACRTHGHAPAIRPTLSDGSLFLHPTSLRGFSTHQARSRAAMDLPHPVALCPSSIGLSQPR